MSQAHELLRYLQRAPYDSDVAGGLFTLKLELLAADTPPGAAGTFAAALGDTAAVRILAFRPLHAYAREHGAFVSEAHPGGKGAIKMPVVRGQDREAAVPVSHRPVEAILLEDAWITGRSGLIRVGDTLLADYHEEELEAWPVDYRFDPIVFDQPADTVVTLIGPEDGPPLDEAISLVGCTSYNFGHWILEYVFRFLILQTQGLADGVPILIDAGLTQSERDALRLYSRDRHPIIEVDAFTSRHVRRLWVPTNLCFSPILPQPGRPFTVDHISPLPSYTARLCRAMASAIEPLPDTPKRVYLARTLSRHRKLLNHVEIMEICRSAGFEIVYPEEHDYLYQASLARNAEVIIGPEGSAMLLAVHARPGTRVLILNHPFLENLPTFTDILDALDLHVEVLSGDCVKLSEGYRKFSDYTIAPDDMRRLLAEWGLTPSGPGAEHAPSLPAPPDAEDDGSPVVPAPAQSRPMGRDGLLRRLIRQIGLR